MNNKHGAIHKVHCKCPICNHEEDVDLRELDENKYSGFSYLIDVPELEVECLVCNSVFTREARGIMDIIEN